MTSNNIECELLYRLFKLHCPHDRRFDVTQALKNYRRIIRLVHPDKCSDPRAHMTTSCLTQIWSLLQNAEHRKDYETFGRIGLSNLEQELNWSEIEETVQYIETLEIGSQQTREQTREESYTTRDEPSTTPSSSGYQTEPTDIPASDAEEENEEPTKDDSHDGYSQQKRDKPKAKPRTSFDESFKQEIKTILGHETRRGVLKFKVQWEGLDTHLWEHQELIYTKFPIDLKGYLKQIQKTRPVSFRTLIRRYEHLGTVLRK